MEDLEVENDDDKLVLELIETELSAEESSELMEELENELSDRLSELAELDLVELLFFTP